MSGWYMINSAMVHSVDAQRLSAKDFRAAFLAALAGEESPLCRFVRGPYIRPPAHEWREIRTRIFARDDYTCTYCGARAVSLECDHIVPVARGGGHADDNLTTACKPCNRSKRSKLVSEWQR